MKPTFQSSFLAYFIAVLAVLLLGCSEPTFVGNDLITGGDEFEVDTATLSVLIYPQREDSIVTNTSISALSLGVVNSPYFGKNKSGFFTELSLSELGADYGSTTELDSIVLILDYLAVLGDSMSMHDIQVYEVTEEIVAGIDTSSTLYNTFEYQYDEMTPLATASDYVFNNVDDVILGSDTVGAQFRIRLEDSLGERFLSENADTTTSTFNTTADFQEWFKGIYVTVDESNSTQNSMAFFDPNTTSSRSRVALYYSKIGVDTTTHVDVSFPININCDKHVYIDTDYNGTGLETLLAEVPPANIYSALAPMAGVNTIVEIPELANYSDVVINKAELIIPVIPFFDNIDTVYARPTETIMAWQEEGEFTGFIQDYLSSGTIYNYDGSLVEDEDTGIDYYRMNIALAAQEIAVGQDSLEMVIYQNARKTGIRRVLLGSGTHPDPNYRAKLNLFYTEIE